MIATRLAYMTRHKQTGGETQRGGKWGKLGVGREKNERKGETESDRKKGERGGGGESERERVREKKGMRKRKGVTQRVCVRIY